MPIHGCLLFKQIILMNIDILSGFKCCFIISAIAQQLGLHVMAYAVQLGLGTSKLCDHGQISLTAYHRFSMRRKVMVNRSNCHLLSEVTQGTVKHIYFPHTI